MCEKPFCVLIEIYEIKPEIKVVIHYKEGHIPFFIQYWDEKTPLDLEFRCAPCIPDYHPKTIHLY